MKRFETQKISYEWRISMPDGTWKPVTADEYNDPHCRRHAATITSAANSLGINFQSVVQRRRVLTKVITTTTEERGEWNPA